MIRRFYIRMCTCPSSQPTRTKEKKLFPLPEPARGAVYVWHISSCVQTSGLYSVMVSTSDSDSGNLGSIPGTTFLSAFLLLTQSSVVLELPGLPTLPTLPLCGDFF
jgi:hypothetical protein